MHKKSEVSLEATASPTMSATSTPMTTSTSSPKTTFAPFTALKVETTVQGTGPGAKQGDTITALYTGMFLDGTVFDASSKHGNQPFEFTLGASQVIKGWDQGMVGAKQGEHRRLFIPAELAYGDAPMVFDIEIIGVTPPSKK